MNTSFQTRFGLTGNQLKIIAMIAMTCDHVGLQLLPHFPILRIIGRLALPIYAYMIAEGCFYTRDRKKYLFRMAALAALCQAVYFFAMGSLYQSILVTFSLSICMIWAYDRENTPAQQWIRAAVTGGVFFLCAVLPDFLPGFEIDYGLPGVLLPVLIYFGKPKWLFLSVGLIILALASGGLQWWAFAALPLLLLYNGQRGKRNMGKVFYIYYPAHLVIIYLISLFI